MCNLHICKLSRAELRGLNGSGLVYPKGAAPVVTVEDGEAALKRKR